MKVRYRIRYILEKDYTIIAMLSSCRISASYVVDDSFYELSIISSKSHDTQSLRRRHLLDLDCDSRVTKEHIYFIFSKDNI